MCVVLQAMIWPHACELDYHSECIMVCYRLSDAVMAFDYSGGGYDPKARKLVVNTYSDGLTAFDGTNSTWQESSWSTSGAAMFNAALFAQIVYHVYFNEVRC